MLRTFSNILILVGLILPTVVLASDSSIAGELKTFSRIITQPDAEYIIEVGGTLDPENVEITIENLGDAPIKDPRITVNGRYDWFDIKSMAADITQGCTTDEEKAIAIWQWVRWKRFQRSPSDKSSPNPVRAMNGYGYGICGHTAAWIKALCLKVDLKARVQEMWGHTVNEIFYDDAWHFFDGNVKVFYLGRDNRTIASIAQLERDRWLIERTIHPREPWNIPEDAPGLNDELANYITTYKDNFVEHSYDYQIGQDYNMSYTLKPGEKLIRWWKPTLNKYENRHNNPLVPERYANGQLIWTPDLKKIDANDYINIIENIATRQQDGASPAIHVKDMQDNKYTRPSRFYIPIKSAYPIVGGRFWCGLFKDNGAAVNVSYGNPGWGAGNLYAYRWNSGLKDIEIDLDQKILHDSPAYEYKIGFNLKANADRKPPAQAGVEWFKSVTDLQVSPHSLPALSLGENIIRCKTNNTGAVKFKINYQWREHDDNNKPGQITSSKSPEKFDTLTPLLKWAPTQDIDQGDHIADYQVMVSLRSDCKWPLSTTLHRNVGSDTCEWKVPKSFLNPGTTYYWKVRARDSRKTIGEWGTIFTFKTTADAK